ncbi:MAG: hypothetical protein KGJ62_08215 [Armatimonadetes bacterium]|nr:hypothetical protein [Armatimonadota bacterium]MDE2205261.1 hypothetical protein [Armatimonadota bacterium]
MGSASNSFTMDNDDELTVTSGGSSNRYSYNANGEQTDRSLADTTTSTQCAGSAPVTETRDCP